MVTQRQSIIFCLMLETDKKIKRYRGQVIRNMLIIKFLRIENVGLKLRGEKVQIAVVQKYH